MALSKTAKNAFFGKRRETSSLLVYHHQYKRFQLLGEASSHFLPREILRLLHHLSGVDEIKMDISIHAQTADDGVCDGRARQLLGM